MPPQKINRGFQAEYTKLSVLSTPQPLLWYQSSETTLSIPNMLIFGEGGKALTLLEQWTKPVTGDLEPPTLKFEFVHLNLPRVKLERVEVVEDMWLDGAAPSRYEVSLTLLLYPETPAVKTAPVAKPDGTNVKLSPAEKEKYLAQVTAKVKTDKKYNYKNGDKIEITDALKVTLNGKEIGKLTDFVQLEKKHQEPVAKEAPKTSPKPQQGTSTTKI